MSELEEFREQKDRFFRFHPQSPLTPEQRERFTGLAYFAEDAALRVEAELETEGLDLDEEIPMDTTTGGTQVYRRAGIARFEVEGAPAQVTLFASDRQWELFLPFRDATSGTLTYGGGRYLEVDRPGPGGLVVVDFNLAYNPYCCYGDRWACPLPPRENWLGVPIRAGEREFPAEAV